jgi:micrococcal nuclease
MYEYSISEVIKVVDGDTLEVVFDVGFSMFCKQRVRLDGIDTPESFTSDANEKKFGLEAKEFLKEWVSKQKKLRAKTTKDDKYGRILARIYGDNPDVCINDEMINKGYAWVYDGGTKQKDFNHLLEQRKKAAV